MCFIFKCLYLESLKQNHPNPEFQLQACNKLLQLSHGVRLSDSLSLCLKKASFMQDQTPQLENPARLLRLMSTLMEGGNERTANLLSSKGGMSIDATCATMVSHIESKRLNLVYVKLGRKIPLAQAKDSAVYLANIGENILNFSTEFDSVAAALFNLITEQLFLLPLNGEQLHSEDMWLWLQQIVGPIMEGLTKVKTMSPAVSRVTGQVVAVLELLFMTFVRLSLFDMTFEDLEKVHSLFFSFSF